MTVTDKVTEPKIKGSAFKASGQVNDPKRDNVAGNYHSAACGNATVNNLNNGTRVSKETAV